MADPASAEQVSARLRRIEGQIRGIARMLESERACEDVVTQLMAVRSGIDTVGALVLDTHLERCFGDAEGPEQIASLRDSMKLWWRFAPGAAGFASGLQPIQPVDPIEPEPQPAEQAES